MALNKGEKWGDRVWVQWGKGALRNDTGLREGQAMKANVLWVTLAIRYDLLPVCILATFPCYLASLLSAELVYHSVAIMPFPHGFLSASPVPSLERAAREPGVIVWDVPVLFLCLGGLPEDVSAGCWQEPCLPCSMHLPRTWPIARVQHIFGWISGWINALKGWFIWSHLHISQMETVMSRGGKEMIPRSIPNQGQRRIRVHFSWPFLPSCHIVLGFGPSSLELGHKDFKLLPSIVE